MRGTIGRELPWEHTVMPDLFFYRDPEEVSFVIDRTLLTGLLEHVRLQFPLFYYCSLWEAGLLLVQRTLLVCS